MKKERIMLELDQALVARIENERRVSEGAIPTRAAVMRDLLTQALDARDVARRAERDRSALLT